MNAASPLDRLADHYGIEPGYTDIWQQEHRIGADTKRALLAAMGVAADSDVEVEASLATADEEAFEPAAPDVVVRREGEQIDLPVAFDTTRSVRLSWSIVSEAGEVFNGDAKTDDLQVTDRNKGLGRQRVRLTLPLADRLPPGYHHCTVSLGSDAMSETEIVITPKRAFWPDCLDQEGGLVGVTAPLYGLRSARNAGIGDFADLATLGETLAPLGASFVGINPVHALFPSQPTRISPYAPSSRSFLNVLMIALDQVPELAISPEAQAILSRSDIESSLNALRGGDLVDYPAVARLKLTVLEALFETFRALPKTSNRQRNFRAFVEAGGERLVRHIRFEALSEHFVRKDGTLTDWHDWPAAYQTPVTAAVQTFAGEYEDRVSFYGYLQWLAATQLEQAQKKATAAGGAIGLYLDLAVGVAADGAEAWSDQEVVVDAVRIGAPPDDFNPKGQNWGLLPLSPTAMQARRYRPFVDLLRQSMRHAGALRIDHVLGLARSFWLPANREVPGAYIRYPMHDLLGLVALESQRQRCLVIGEDLGTVPNSLRSALTDQGLLGCSLLYFERDEQGKCRPAPSYPKARIASISTHDLPTLKGFWEGRDIDWRGRLGLYADADQQRLDREEREKLKAELLTLVDAEGLLPQGFDPAQPPASLTWPLVEVFHGFISRTQAALKVIQLEDALSAIEQANLPGTIDEHPNWRRKITVPLEELAREHGLVTLLRLFVEQSQ
ncbi:MAG: 4-alpha-glucanotransferase [Geminicoccaceae bacterium]